MIRAALMSFAVIAILGAAGLVLAAGADERATAFSASVPNAEPVATLAPGRQACQRPIPAPAAFGGLVLWVADVRPPTTLNVTVSGPGVPAASGSARAASAGALSVHLDRDVSAGQSVSVCFRDVGPGSASLQGSAPGPDSGALDQNGRQPARAAALVALAPHERSLLSLLPTVFRRAALFHPTWVGAWTFWLLLAALIVAAALTGVALAQAVREDEPPSAPGAPAPSTPPGAAPRSRP